MNRLEGRFGVNVGNLIGHSTVRRAARQVLRNTYYHAHNA
jgi:hypothetical protein